MEVFLFSRLTRFPVSPLIVERIQLSMDQRTKFFG